MRQDQPEPRVRRRQPELETGTRINSLHAFEEQHGIIMIRVRDSKVEFQSGLTSTRKSCLPNFYATALLHVALVGDGQVVAGTLDEVTRELDVLDKVLVGVVVVVGLHRGREVAKLEGLREASTGRRQSREHKKHKAEKR